jgi:integrase
VGIVVLAGLRPEEAINLSADNVILLPRTWDAERQPWQDPPEDGDWGELHLRTATPDAGSECTDDSSSRERRQLKHRAEGDIRIVPTHPELTRLLRDHLASFGLAEDGRFFAGIRGGELPTITYRRAWVKARQTALTCGGASLATRPTAIRPAACLLVHVAERRRLSHSGGGVGRAQCGRAAADLRQVRRGPGRVRQAPQQAVMSGCDRDGQQLGAPTSSGTGSPSARSPAM